MKKGADEPREKSKGGTRRGSTLGSTASRGKVLEIIREELHALTFPLRTLIFVHGGITEQQRGPAYIEPMISDGNEGSISVVVLAYMDWPLSGGGLLSMSLENLSAVQLQITQAFKSGNIQNKIANKLEQLAKSPCACNFEGADALMSYLPHVHGVLVPQLSNAIGGGKDGDAFVSELKVSAAMGDEHAKVALGALFEAKVGLTRSDLPQGVLPNNDWNTTEPVPKARMWKGLSSHET